MYHQSKTTYLLRFFEPVSALQISAFGHSLIKSFLFITIIHKWTYKHQLPPTASTASTAGHWNWTFQTIFKHTKRIGRANKQKYLKKKVEDWFYTYSQTHHTNRKGK